MSRCPANVAPALEIRKNRRGPAPLARPYLVPTRGWGVVVDPASVPENQLSRFALVKHSIEANLATDLEASRERLATLLPAARKSRRSVLSFCKYVKKTTPLPLGGIVRVILSPLVVFPK